MLQEHLESLIGPSFGVLAFLVDGDDVLQDLSLLLRIGTQIGRGEEIAQRVVVHDQSDAHGEPLEMVILHFSAPHVVDVGVQRCVSVARFLDRLAFLFRDRGYHLAHRYGEHWIRYKKLHRYINVYMLVHHVKVALYS